MRAPWVSGPRLVLDIPQPSRTGLPSSVRADRAARLPSLARSRSRRAATSRPETQNSGASVGAGSGLPLVGQRPIMHRRMKQPAASPGASALAPRRVAPWPEKVASPIAYSPGAVVVRMQLGPQPARCGMRRRVDPRAHRERSLVVTRVGDADSLAGVEGQRDVSEHCGERAGALCAMMPARARGGERARREGPQAKDALRTAAGSTRPARPATCPPRATPRSRSGAAWSGSGTRPRPTAIRNSA